MFLDLRAIRAAVSIEDAAHLLKLPLKKSGNQLRSNCPSCGNEDERIFVITRSRGLFYCFDAKVGGDCLALV
jgi:hypothetical protein